MSPVLTFDLRDFERCARRMDAFASQIPFALAGALNDGAEVVRKDDLPRTWSEHITARNARFITAALTTKGERATKKMLRVTIYDRFGRANLKLHDVGGTRRPRGNTIAVPNKINLQSKRGAHGVPKGLRPRNVPNSFVKQSKFGPVLFQRVGTYQKATKRAIKAAKRTDEKRPKGTDGRKLRAMYGLAPATHVEADVPFHQDFDRAMRRAVMRAFGPRLRLAMATARKKK